MRWREIEPRPLRDPALAPFDTGHDLFGDSSLVMVLTPGHTARSSSLIVRRPGRPTLALVGDLNRAGDFVASVRKLTEGRVGGAGVDAAFDAIGGSHFDQSFACLAPGGTLIGYGSQTMAIGHESIIAAGLGLARLRLWSALSFLFRGRRALWYSITDRRLSHPEEFRADMAALFELLRNGAIHPVVIGREPLAAAKNVHARIDAGGLGGKLVLLPWLESQGGA
jgi:NADPH:quinone reductase-like Zn-dependent oxidoreductase